MLAVTAFRKAGRVEEASRTRSELEIEVREPAVKHTVTLAQLQRWANGVAQSLLSGSERSRSRSYWVLMNPTQSANNDGAART